MRGLPRSPEGCPSPLTALPRRRPWSPQPSPSRDALAPWLQCLEGCAGPLDALPRGLPRSIHPHSLERFPCPLATVPRGMHQFYHNTPQRDALVPSPFSQ